MKTIWSKIATTPVSRQAAAGVSYAPSNLTQRPLAVPRLERPVESPSPAELARARILVSLIGSKNAKIRGVHFKGGMYANKLLRRGISHEEMMRLLASLQDDPKYGGRIKEFLAKRRSRTLEPITKPD